MLFNYVYIGMSMPTLMPMLMPMPRFPKSQMIWPVITFVTLIFLFMNWDNIGIFNSRGNSPSSMQEETHLCQCKRKLTFVNARGNSPLSMQEEIHLCQCKRKLTFVSARGNSPLSMQELKFSAINLAIRSLFSLMILVGISPCWRDFLILRLLIILPASSQTFFWNRKLSWAT